MVVGLVLLPSPWLQLLVPFTIAAAHLVGGRALAKVLFNAASFGVGVYLADPKHTNMENYGVQPDIRVDNSPEDNLSGRDRQLEAAVEELLKELGGAKRNIASKEQQ